MSQVRGTFLKYFVPTYRQDLLLLISSQAYHSDSLFISFTHISLTVLVAGSIYLP